MKFTNLILSFYLLCVSLAAVTTTIPSETATPKSITTTGVPSITPLTVERKAKKTTTTSSATVSPTLVWITTTTAGNPATIQVTYSQVFKSFYTKVAVPSSGSIGLGTISGTVGQVRSYRILTVSSGTTATD